MKKFNIYITFFILYILKTIEGKKYKEYQITELEYVFFFYRIIFLTLFTLQGQFEQLTLYFILNLVVNLRHTKHRAVEKYS